LYAAGVDEFVVNLEYGSGFGFSRVVGFCCCVGGDGLVIECAGIFWEIIIGLVFGSAGLRMVGGFEVDCVLGLVCIGLGGGGGGKVYLIELE
jgi:hypothetical protein